MLKRYVIILVISQLLLNSVCASAHIAGNDHSSKHSPDIHLDAYHYPDIHQDEETTEANSAISAGVNTGANTDIGEHKRHSHCHTHLHVFLISTEIKPIMISNNQKRIFCNYQLTSLTHRPPIPPPTA